MSVWLRSPHAQSQINTAEARNTVRRKAPAPNEYSAETPRAENYSQLKEGGKKIVVQKLELSCWSSRRELWRAPTSRSVLRLASPARSVPRLASCWSGAILTESSWRRRQRLLPQPKFNVRLKQAWAIRPCRRSGRVRIGTACARAV